jgi:hypothetical protein
MMFPAVAPVVSVAVTVLVDDADVPTLDWTRVCGDDAPGSGR